jgi:hypothetical protein
VPFSLCRLFFQATSAEKNPDARIQINSKLNCSEIIGARSPVAGVACALFNCGKRARFLRWPPGHW